MPNECPACERKNALILSLFTYVLDDYIDTYERLKEEYGNEHPEVKSMGELLTRFALVLNKKL